mgnify:FL=1
MRGLKHSRDSGRCPLQHVAPPAGAWIETDGSLREKLLTSPSHPLRVRGLKLNAALVNILSAGSHPLRVRGLKPPEITNNRTFLPSHPLRVRGLKHLNVSVLVVEGYVAPPAGAWIETPFLSPCSTVC